METQDDHVDNIEERTGKLVAKARPKLHINTDDFFNDYFTIQREWIDVEPGPCDKSCFDVTKKDDQIAST